MLLAASGSPGVQERFPTELLASLRGVGAPKIHTRGVRQRAAGCHRPGSPGSSPRDAGLGALVSSFQSPTAQLLAVDELFSQKKNTVWWPMASCHRAGGMSLADGVGWWSQGAAILAADLGHHHGQGRLSMCWARLSQAGSAVTGVIQPLVRGRVK